MDASEFIPRWEGWGLICMCQKKKNHGLKNPRCMGIYPLGYCGECIKNKQEEKKHESTGNKF
jgi:hypothetical protein